MGFSIAEPVGEDIKAKTAYEQHLLRQRTSRIEKFAEMLTRTLLPFFLASLLFPFPFLFFLWLTAVLYTGLKRIPSLAFATSPTQKNGETYCCAQCGRILFGKAHILPHAKVPFSKLFYFT